MTKLADKAHYTPGEVIAFFSLSKSIFYQRVDEGKIKVIYPAGVMRVTREEVERMKNQDERG